MPVFHEIKGSLMANVEAAKVILEVGEASSETIDAVIVLLETTIGALKDALGEPQQVSAAVKEHPVRTAGKPTQEIPHPSAPTPAKHDLEKVAIKKRELMQMGVSLSTIREWQDEGKLKKAGKFGLYSFNQEVRNLVDDHLAAKKGRARMETAPAMGDSPETISRGELIRRGVVKSTIGYWAKTGKLRKTGVPGKYVVDGAVAKLLANYRRRRSGVEITEEEARRGGKISRTALIQKGVKGGTIGYWISKGKLQKADEKGYYVYDEAAQRLLKNYRPKPRK